VNSSTSAVSSVEPIHLAVLPVTLNSLV
jgi:hypothetical protein